MRAYAECRVMSVVAPENRGSLPPYDQPTKDRADGALPLLWTPEELTHSPGIAISTCK